MSQDDDTPELGTKSGDLIAAAGRIAFGWIPGIGPAINELITQFIPDQRAERIEQYLRFLDQKLSHIPVSELRERTLNTEAAAIVEDGGFQAARDI